MVNDEETPSKNNISMWGSTVALSSNISLLTNLSHTCRTATTKIFHTVDDDLNQD